MEKGADLTRQDSERIRSNMGTFVAKIVLFQEHCQESCKVIFYVKCISIRCMASFCLLCKSYF